jgi:phosphoesterase RecJ-like protein
VRPDCDAVGSTKGLRDILRLSFPEKEIYVINNDSSDKTAFLGGDDPEIDSALYADALGISLDAATPDRIANGNYTLCRELIKIDHHINVAPYGDIEWVDHTRSSTCEMVVEFYCAFSELLRINLTAATYLYAGIIADSGSFKFDAVSGDTLRCAAVLKDLGVDTDRIYANLYLDDFSSLAFRSFVYENVKRTDAGVLYTVIDRATQEKFKLTTELAGEAVNCLDSVKGSLIWIAFIEADGKLRARIRSRFVHINGLAQKYGGGGHACACGAYGGP